MKVMLSLMIVGVALMATADKQPLERYQPIIDRQMFGRVPAGFDPTKPPSTLSPEERKKLEQQQEQLKSAIRLSAINIRPNGTVAVGFTDSGIPSKPMHYYLGVGEARDGWLVKSADPETAVAVIAKGDVEITLTLGEDSAKKADATARAGSAKPSAEGASENGGKESDTASDEEGNVRPRSVSDMRERRRQRMERERKLDEEARLRRQQEAEERKAESESFKQELANLKEDLERERIEREEQKLRDEEAAKRRVADGDDPPPGPPPDEPPPDDHVDMGSGE